jgi:putative endonuclease
LYTGVTKDVERRFSEHNSQGIKCARYLRGKLPLFLIYSEKTKNKKEAYKIEALIKKLPKHQKEALVNGGLSRILSCKKEKPQKIQDLATENKAVKK